MTVAGNDILSSIKTFGRTFVKGGILWLSYSGCGAEFAASGDLEIGLVADSMIFAPDRDIHYARYAVISDGVTVLDERLDCERRTVRIPAEGSHVYRVIKLSESGDSCLGISGISAEGDICATPAGKLRFEFLGDSITCGYGVDGSLSEIYTTATENAAEAWAYLTAQRFGADYSIVSRSGSGLISGYTPDGVRDATNIFMDHFDRCGCSSAVLPCGGSTGSEPYSHEFDPDVVFINLGTNDTSYCHPLDMFGRLLISEEEELRRKAEFCEAYLRMLRRVREVSPRAKLICMLGAMGGELIPDVRLAVQKAQEEGMTDIFFLPLAEQDPKEAGYGTDYHPSRITQRLIADAVCSFAEGVL